MNLGILNNQADLLWLGLCIFLLFFMQYGFLLLESGLIREKNNINIAAKNLIDFGVSMLSYWLIGFSLMYGRTFSGYFGQGSTGTDSFLFDSKDISILAFFLFNAGFVATFTTIISGSVVERMKYSSYIIVTIIAASFLYPIFGHWVWADMPVHYLGEGNNKTGWLKALGYTDFSGSSVLHVAAGFVSLALIIVIGPRRDFITSVKDKTSFDTRRLASNLPTSVGGCIILLIGFLGFNTGSTYSFDSTAIKIVVNSVLSASAAMIVAGILGYIKHKFFDILSLMNGLLAGLVAVCASVNIITSLEAVILGCLTGIIVELAGSLLIKYKIDDPISILPVHLSAGIGGILYVSFVKEGDFYKTLSIQSLGILIAFFWFFVIPLLIFKIINLFHKFRVSDKAEYDGLNVSEHGASSELADMYRVMSIQESTGNLSLRLEENAYTTIGKISTRYNRVLNTLKTVEDERKNILENTFSSINEGVCILDDEFKTTNSYSSSLDRILGVTFSKKLDFKDDILKKIVLEEELKEQLDLFFKLLKEKKVNNKNIGTVSPIREIEVFTSSRESTDLAKKKYLSIDIREFKSSNKDNYILIISDITKERNLNLELIKQKNVFNEEIKLLYKILHIDLEIINDFIDESMFEINNIKNYFEKASSSQEKITQKILYDILANLFRSIHTVKSSASALDLEQITTFLHNFEEKISDLRKVEDINSTSLVSLLPSINAIEEQILRIITLRDKIIKFYQKDQSNKRQQHGIITDIIKSMIENLTKKFKNKVNCITQDFNYLEIPQKMRKSIKDMLLQLIRNSIYHGIEPPDIREKKGKDKWGNIKISSSLKNNKVNISYEDDGQGIDFEKVKAKAIENGIETEVVSKWKDKNIIDYLFQQGVSTADEADDVAGRGVGMNIVRTSIEKLKGKLDIKTKSDQYFKINVTLPI